MIKTVRQKFRRALHFDFHTAPGIENIFGNFDAEKFADQLADSKTEYINFTARCNMGFSYYNTKVGKKYPGLGDRDVLEEAIRACRKRNIGITAYLNIGLDHDISADHYDWLRVNKDGTIYKADKVDNFFRTMCYNSPYREHLLSEIAEIVTYDIDGVFCDCVSHRECYCPRCIADMRAKGYDETDHVQMMKYQDEVRHKLCHEISDFITGKGLKVYFNGMPWTDGLHTHGEVECIPNGGHWGYDYFDSKAAYARTLFEDRVYMSGRFQDEWGDFGGIKPLASMQNDLYDAMMNSFGMSFGDHLHPVDGFENEVVKRIKTVFEEKMLYEPYTDNSENIVEVGIVVNNATYKMNTKVKGLARMLKELKVNYNIYDERGDLEDMELLIFCEEIDLTDKLRERLNKFLSKGGKTIFAATALKTGKELGILDYIEEVGDDKNDNAYYTTPDNDMRWAMYSPSKLVKNISGTEVAKYVSNVFNLVWDGRQSYFYRPQGKATDLSAAVLKDSSAYVCFDIFGAYADMFLTEHKLLFKKLLDQLLPSRLIMTEKMPQTATVALTKNEEHTVFHVKATYPEIKMGRGIIEEHNYMKSCEVSLKGEYEVYSLPELMPVSSRKENGRTVFETGDVLGYKAFLLK